VDKPYGSNYRPMSKLNTIQGTIRNKRLAQIVIEHNTSINDANCLADDIEALLKQEQNRLIEEVSKRLEEMKLNPDIAKRWFVGSPEDREEREYDKALSDAISSIEELKEGVRE
jgi:hypothetical protein